LGAAKLPSVEPEARPPCENEQLKQVVAELLLKNRALKKSALGGETSTWDE